jgi:molybdate transport system substrate-binding protein
MEAERTVRNFTIWEAERGNFPNMAVLAHWYQSCVVPLRTPADALTGEDIMAKGLKFTLIALVAWGFILSMGPTQHSFAENLTVGAAYSLRPAFHEIVPLFEREYGATVQILYGPSQTLRQQIEKGAPIDVFLPAAAIEVQKLEGKGLTLNGGARVFAQTSLVLVTPTTSRATPISFTDMVTDQRIRMALADPKTTSLGEITARSLTRLNSAYKSQFRLMHAEHSEHILQLLHNGEADMGIIYRVDAINNRHVRIVDEHPTGSYVPVSFGLAVVSTCRESSMETAERFVDFITSPRIQKLLLKYGFDAVPSNGIRAGN